MTDTEKIKAIKQILIDSYDAVADESYPRGIRDAVYSVASLEEAEDNG